MRKELSSLLKRAQTTEPVDPQAAEASAEQALAAQREALQAAEAALPTSAAAAVLTGQGADFESRQAEVGRLRAAVLESELVVQGFREQRQIREANERAADVNRRQREAERLLAVEATEGMQKVQAGLDLLIAGYRQARSAANQARMTFPRKMSWWPDLWGNQFEGQMRRYLAARGGPFSGNILASDYPAILAGPDLLTLHKNTVNDVLGTHRNDTEAAA